MFFLKYIKPIFLLQLSSFTPFRIEDVKPVHFCSLEKSYKTPIPLSDQTCTSGCTSLKQKDINQRISSEFCPETIRKLGDQQLLPEYLTSKSVQKSVKTLSSILEKHIGNHSDFSIVKKEILEEYLVEMIPPGTKGVIRGNKFNQIVQEKIQSLHLPTSIYEIAFEKECKTVPTSEIPDWYITNKLQNRTLIGMNQLDLWGGGAQLNRAAKYIMNDPFENNVNVKLICVVCNFIYFKSERNKAFHIMEKGFERNTICYMNSLENRIREYFM